MLSRSYKSTVALALLLGLAACAINTAPRTDAQLGESVQALRALQVMRPEASLNRDPVSGVDGKAAREAQAAYRDSFRKPAGDGLVLPGLAPGGATQQGK